MTIWNTQISVSEYLLSLKGMRISWGVGGETANSKGRAEKEQDESLEYLLGPGSMEALEG